MAPDFVGVVVVVGGIDTDRVAVSLAAPADGPFSVTLDLSALAAHAGDGDPVSPLLCGHVVWRRLGGDLHKLVGGAIQQRSDKLSVRLLVVVEGRLACVLLLVQVQVLLVHAEADAYLRRRAVFHVARAAGAGAVATAACRQGVQPGRDAVAGIELSAGSRIVLEHTHRRLRRRHLGVLVVPVGRLRLRVVLLQVLRVVVVVVGWVLVLALALLSLLSLAHVAVATPRRRHGVPTVEAVHCVLAGEEGAARETASGRGSKR